MMAAESRTAATIINDGPENSVLDNNCRYNRQLVENEFSGRLN